MNEYRIVLPKTQQGGFASDPDQTISNAGSPNLDQTITAKNAIGIGIAAMYGKRIVQSGFKAMIGQLGNSEVEASIERFSKLAGYAGIAFINPYLAGAAIITDTFISTIDYAVESHAINLENERIIEARGTRRQFNAGGYYG